MRLRGIPKFIVSNQESKFLSHLWRTLRKKLGNNVLFSSYHPQTDGQTEVVNRNF